MLNRLELRSPATARDHCYRKVAADEAKLDAALLNAFLDMHATAREEIVIDRGATDDPVHGKRQRGEYRSDYRRYCFPPLCITCSNQVLAVRVRRSKIDSVKRALGELKRVVERIRGPLAGVRVTVRSDSGFCRDRIMVWCDREDGIRHVFGLVQPSGATLPDVGQLELRAAGSGQGGVAAGATSFQPAIRCH